MTTELDALALEEEEAPSYLADLNKAPDFIDEAPAELAEVSSTPFALPTDSFTYVTSSFHLLNRTRRSRLQHNHEDLAPFSNGQGCFVYDRAAERVGIAQF